MIRINLIKTYDTENVTLNIPIINKHFAKRLYENIKSANFNSYNDYITYICNNLEKLVDTKDIREILNFKKISSIYSSIRNYSKLKKLCKCQFFTQLDMIHLFEYCPNKPYYHNHMN